jgi:hypothetical protein
MLAEARLCRAFVFSSVLSLSFFKSTSCPALLPKRSSGQAAAPANHQDLALGIEDASPKKNTTAGAQGVAGEGYPRSMSKKKRDRLATYRQSESELFENPISAGSNVNNL